MPTIAAGNGGENDWASGNARIQSPADCVNGMTIGSCDKMSRPWQRSSHSSIGPGRSPGIIKRTRWPLAVLTHIRSSSWTQQGDERFRCSGPVLHRRPLSGPGLASDRTSAPCSLHLQYGPCLCIVARTTDFPAWKSAGDGFLWRSTIWLPPTNRHAHIVYQGELTPAQWLRGSDPGAGYTDAWYGTGQRRPSASPLKPIHKTLSTTRELGWKFDSARTTVQGRRLNNLTRTPSHFSKPASFTRLRMNYGPTHTSGRPFFMRRCECGSSLNNPSFDIHYHARAAGPERGRRATSPMR